MGSDSFSAYLRTYARRLVSTRQPYPLPVTSLKKYLCMKVRIDVVNSELLLTRYLSEHVLD